MLQIKEGLKKPEHGREGTTHCLLGKAGFCTYKLNEAVLTYTRSAQDQVSLHPCTGTGRQVSQQSPLLTVDGF